MRRKVLKENCLDIVDVFGVKLVINVELEEVGKEIIKFEQNFIFVEELEVVKGGKCVKGLSVFVRLDLILIDGFFCVGGCFSRVILLDDFKYQIIIFKDFYLVCLFVNYFYQKSGYFGREYVLVLLCECFWLICVNFIVRSVFLFCFDCK